MSSETGPAPAARIALATIILAFLVPSLARAEQTGSAEVSPPSNYQLQADAYGRAEPGVALLTLQGAGDSEWVSAEAMVWGGLRQDLYYDGFEGDVLVIAVKVHDPTHRAELKLGRFVEHSGAIRPVHIDGASARVRLPWNFRVKAYGGMPIVARFDSDNYDYDWVVGGRVSRGIGDWGSVGVAYQHRRDAGRLADEEVGFDAGANITDWLDANTRISYDLVNPGVSEARGVVAAHHADWRLELFGTHRSPTRLLSQNSLFSVLSNVASRRFGTSFDYQVAPRLDLEATAAARFIDSDIGESISAGAVLRLDDVGRSAIRVEGRREGVQDGDWTGIRIAGRFAIIEDLAAITEVELVIPDDARGRGSLWPWALAGLTWKPAPRWRLAGAIQGSASAEHESRLDGMARLTYLLGGL